MAPGKLRVVVLGAVAAAALASAAHAQADADGDATPDASNLWMRWLDESRTNNGTAGNGGGARTGQYGDDAAMRAELEGLRRSVAEMSATMGAMQVRFAELRAELDELRRALPSAFAAAQTAEHVLVSTDRDSYAGGETVNIGGSVLQKHRGDISIKVTAPNGNIVAIGQPSLDADNTFFLALATGGLMGEAGEYTIEANYSLDAKKSPRLATAAFMFTPAAAPAITVDGTGFEPDFMATGGTVLGMYTNPQANALVVDLDAGDGGRLTIALPRTLIDSTLANGGDDAFFVLVDGEEAPYDESATTDDSGTLEIDFSAGSEIIEIVGTSVASPEF